MHQIQRYVLDNSVLIKLLVEEDQSFKVERLVALAQDYKISILVPELFVFEYYNIANRLIGSAPAFEAFEFFSAKQFSVLKLGNHGMNIAMKIMSELDCRVTFYDASYHALAIENGATFLTADEKYYKNSAKFGAIELLEDFDFARL